MDLDKLLLLASTACFLAGFLYAVASLRSGKHNPTKTNLAVLGLGFLLQCWVLHIRGQLHGRCPITNGPEIIIFIAWSLSLLYFVLGRAFRLSLLGMFTAPLVFVFQVSALVMLQLNDPGPSPRERVDPWFEVHVSVSLLAYGAFALAAIAGIMYLVQDRQLKRGQLGRLFQNLPPIRYLVDAMMRVVGIALILFGVGIVSAFFIEMGVATAHIIGPIIVWLYYAVLLGLFMGRKMGPKKFAGGSACGLLLSMAVLALLS